MTHIDTMKQALEYIEQNNYGGDDSQRIMFALRLAIEQAERQEPIVAEKVWWDGENLRAQPIRASEFYAAPPQRQPLTDEELWKFWWDRPEVPEGEDDSMEAEFVAACRRVLAAHGIGGDK